MMRVQTAVVFGLAAALLWSPALAQQKPSPTVLTVHPLRGGVYWVEGGVSNTGFIVGHAGVVVFDPQKTADDARLQLAEIAKITSKPVDTLIISHADPDHVGGIPAYPNKVAIIEQENTESEIAASARDPSAPPPLATLYKELLNHPPTRVLGGPESTTIDGVRVDIMYVAPAHTSGDLFAYLPAQKIVFGGDIVLTNTGRFPVIHFGGSSLGWIACVKAMLALDADTYVPGHGPLESKAQLVQRLHDVEERRAQIKVMVLQGKTLDEVERALPEPGASPMFKDFTQTVYAELTEGYPPASPPWTNLIKH